jgi:hypothetical protein
LSDETRKQGDVYEIFAVRDQTGKNWVLGLKEMVNKSSQSCLNTLKSIINDTHSQHGLQVLQSLLTNVIHSQSYSILYKNFFQIVTIHPSGEESKSETARFSKKSESGTIRLIRTTSKCLARGADDKSGCFAYSFTTWSASSAKFTNKCNPQ